MEVGAEFTSWNCFIQELEKYSKDNKISYSLGLCNPVETAISEDEFSVKVVSKFKYLYARLVCSHGIKSKQDKWKHKSTNRCPKSNCQSSILVCVNKGRDALVIMEANLNHNHTQSLKMLSTETQLTGEERRIASVLLRGGVPLYCVQEFISHFLEIKIDDKSQNLSEEESLFGSKNQQLFHLDQFMAENPGGDIEFIDFNHIPDVVYFQSDEMKERVQQMGNGIRSSIQLITLKHANKNVSIISIVAVNEEMDPHVLAFCISMGYEGSSCRNFVETFVKHNQKFCNNVNGLVVDYDKQDAEFIQLFFPQAHVAWSKEYIVNCFEKNVRDLIGYDDHYLTPIFEEMSSSSSEFEYNNALKSILEEKNSNFSTHFLTHWDSCRDMWVQYKIDSVDALSHQKAAIEKCFVNKIHQSVQADCELADILQSLICMDKNEEVGNNDDKKNEELVSNPCRSFYRSLCLPKAAEAVICQAAIAEHSKYNINKSGSKVFIQRLDTEEEFRLNVPGSHCSCQYFTRTQLPCEHIFAWRRIYDLNVCDEFLIPLKWQVLGESVTLDSLAQSLAQGYVPSSAHHEERLKTLQAVLKDILTSCASHSYEDMGKDIILLKQILSVIKHGNVEAKSKVIEDKRDANIESCKSSPAIAAGPATVPKKRGRKSKKEKEILAAKERIKVSSHHLEMNQTGVERRHNLRTNIKHKFVTRESPSTIKLEETISNNALKEMMTPMTNSDPICSSSLNVIHMDSEKKSTEENDFQISWGKDNELNHFDISRIQPVSLSDKDEDFGESRVKRFKRDRPYFDINDRKYKILKNNDENDYSSNESDSYDDGVDYLTKKRLVDENDYENLDREEEYESSGSKQARPGQDLSKFLEGMSVEYLQELMQGISMLDHFDERSQNDEDTDNNQLIYPVDFVIHGCHKDKENLDFIIRNLEKQISDYNKFAYRVAASLILTAFNTGAEVSEIRESINDWPSHLPPLSTTPDDDVGLPLEADQVLTVCGYKLDKTDIETLNSNSELSPRVIHAYLEVLAQRHNGKMFVIPFDVVQHWRNETYSEMLFKKVHFKTFDFLVLPIHCGAEFSSDEILDDGEMVSPQWMVLVADVHNKTVGMLNPRTEDKYLIAANGYILQWRRYMQIRSVLTGEMLSAWTTQTSHCNKQTMNHTSGALAVMNVEAVICNVPSCVMTEAHINHYVHYVGVTLRDTDRETTVLCVGGLQCQEMAAQDTDWLQCQNCRAWWHRACCGCEEAGIGGGDINTFYCSPCKQRIAAVKSCVGVLGNEIAEEDREEDGGDEDFERGERRYDNDEPVIERDDEGNVEEEYKDGEHVENRVIIQSGLNL